MKKYNLINNILGWLSFTIAAIVYLLTIEPTASFWDCGEFITSAFKFEVGHPPGAPFFMLTGKFFSLFASDPSGVAKMVNSMSALLSAATILFLFWTITHLAKKLIYPDTTKPMTMGQICAIMGSGLVGALVYTFSDTFWFSAVEGEVYAYSSMFTALVFWLILKWENRADQEGSDKWIVLIAYTMGLSIGVHLLNLLCIPAIVLIYYFKKAEKVDKKGIFLSLIGSMALIVVLMYGIIPGFTKVGGWFELFFVNKLGFSYDVGTLFYILLLLCAIVWALYETLSPRGSLNRAKIAYVLSMALSGITFISGNWLIWLLLLGGLIVFSIKSNKFTFRLINTSMLCLLFILIGYSSFAIIPIRSAANTPMDQNSPEDVFSLADYLNREQYGESPLFYGKTYASQVKRDASGSPVEASTKKKYDKIVKQSPDQKDEYFVASTSNSYEFTNTMLFPRMYSDDPRHIQGYKKWGGITNEKVTPTFFENLNYLFSYQINFMYWRYFMWNFAGRQNDIQSLGNISNGNWMTGIKFFDEHVLGLGPQDELPPHIANNKGHNVYYMLPLLLGIIGLIYQLTRGSKGERQFWVTFMLFFMTGLAIVLYLNQKPFEPRERDYAYAGSFYAFSIWVGLGVAGIWWFLKRYISSDLLAPVVSLLALLVPIQMASQNWDDHDRSDRYTMRDFGMNYLRSIAPNGIIFTNGDNDTFPLWYAQEVEGFRTDVRVTNLSYLQTDWYVDQMRRQAYNSAPLPIEWDKSKYIGDKGMYAYVLGKDQIEGALMQQIQQQAGSNALSGMNVDLGVYYDKSAFKDTLILDEVMTALKTNDSYVPKNPFISAGEKNTLIVPGNKLFMPIDSASVDWKTLGSTPSSGMTINLKDKNVVYRQEMMIMEMLNNINKDNWKRPIYFARTVGSDMYMNLKDQFSLEGLAYRIVPGTPSETGVNTEVAFNNMMKEFKWGGVENPKVYLDENNMRMTKTFRITFAELIFALIDEGKNDKALEALDYSFKVIPTNTVPLTGEGAMLADAYYQLGKPEKGDEVIKTMTDLARNELKWYHRLKPEQMSGGMYDIRDNFDILLRAAIVYNNYGEFDKYATAMQELQEYAQVYFKNGINPLGTYALKSMADAALRGYADQEKDSEEYKNQEKIVYQIMKLMQEYNPTLLQEYVKS